MTRLNYDATPYDYVADLASLSDDEVARFESTTLGDDGDERLVVAGILAARTGFSARSVLEEMNRFRTEERFA